MVHCTVEWTDWSRMLFLMRSLTVPCKTINGLLLRLTESKKAKAYVLLNVFKQFECIFWNAMKVYVKLRSSLSPSLKFPCLKVYFQTKKRFLSNPHNNNKKAVPVVGSVQTLRPYPFLDALKKETSLNHKPKKFLIKHSYLCRFTTTTTHIHYQALWLPLKKKWQCTHLLCKKPNKASE